MRFVSLFAGVGGFDLGLELAGHECIAQVEIDKHCRSVLDKHWPHVPKHDDVRSAIEFADRVGLVGRTDLVCGGFPCQDVSVAGKRAGLAGERTGLFWDALAFTTHVQARWLLLENVPGLLTSNQGRDFGTILLALADAGLPHIEWRVLDSQFFGVPQRRRRVFLVASSGAPSRRPILAEREGRCWDPGAIGEAREDLAGAASGSIGFSHTQGLDIQASTKAFPTLRTGGGGHAVAIGRKTDGDVDQEPTGDELGGLRDMEAGGGVSPTLNAFDNATETRATVLALDVRNGSMNEDTTMTLQGGGMGQDRGLCINAIPHAVVAPTLSASNNPSRSPQSAEVTARVKATHDAIGVVRRLTPVECERLQGFPDDWTAGLADSHRYKQMGNAVTVNVAFYIGGLLT